MIVLKHVPCDSTFVFTHFQFVLSQQRARVDHLKDVFSLSDIVDVAAFNDGVVLLLVNGGLLQIVKRGRDIVKKSIPIARVAKFFLRDNLLR